ncbi:MAG: hypothetical protein N2449_02800 [Bacteroidales bacterium]|nr:hypothetical protein [Bacteroidales bacterium]
MKILFLLILSLMLVSCIEYWDNELKKKHINSELIYKPESVRRSEINLKTFIIDNSLQLKFNIGHFKNLTFPDSVILYEWYVRFYFNSKIIHFPPLLNNTFLRKKEIIGIGNSLQFQLTNVLSNCSPCNVELNVPFYLFHEIKAGESPIVVELFAGFKTRADSLNFEPVKTIDGILFRWMMNIHIPKIYHTQIISKEILLQDDESFSPRGMDFSFRDGLPDIYWMITYPLEPEKPKGQLYWRSQEATYADKYTNTDTIDFLHYSKKERLIFSVYDRDDFSKDDFIGDWYGHFLSLYNDTFKSLTFDHVQSFKVKAINKGCINCR